MGCGEVVVRTFYEVVEHVVGFYVVMFNGCSARFVLIKSKPPDESLRRAVLFVQYLCFNQFPEPGYLNMTGKTYVTETASPFLSLPGVQSGD